MKISDKEFEEMIAKAMDELPQEYIEGLQNVAIVYEDDPSPEQRQRLKLRCGETLFGLYEGIPRTKRPAAESIFSGQVMTLSDKITIFKNPMLHAANSLDEFKSQVKHTLWHEIAHYYGLDHDRIHEIERNWH
jgi:predicted Zn-dependent protease with MMP-like domain